MELEYLVLVRYGIILAGAFFYGWYWYHTTAGVLFREKENNPLLGVYKRVVLCLKRAIN